MNPFIQIPIIPIQKAGVRARLSQKGVNYISTFLKDILIQQVAGPSPLNNNEEIQIQVHFPQIVILEIWFWQLEGGKTKLQDLHLDVQKGPSQLRTKTEAPKQALVEMPAINFVYEYFGLPIYFPNLFQFVSVAKAKWIQANCSKWASSIPHFYWMFPPQNMPKYIQNFLQIICPK